MEKENKGKSKFWKGVLAGSLVTALAGFGIVGVATGISVIGRTVIENQAQNTTAEGSGSAHGLGACRHTHHRPFHKAG